jgi:archaellum component FlaC
MKTVDTEISKKILALTDKNNKLLDKNEGFKQQIKDLKKVLEMAVSSEAQKDAILEETKAAFNNERIKLKEKDSKLDQDQTELTDFKTQLKQSNLSLQNKIEELNYLNSEL